MAAVSVRELARHPHFWVLALSVAVHLTGVLVVPELWLRWSGKESAFEHFGHAALALAAGAWLAVFARIPKHRLFTACVCLYLAFCLLEEIDWGAVYGVDLGYTRIQSWSGGSQSLHNARVLERGPLGWILLWMTVPMVAYFGSGLLPQARLGSLGAVLPTSVEAVLFGATVVVSIVFDGLHLLHRRLGYVPRAPAGGSLGDALGWFQITFYVLWILVGVRILREKTR